MATRTAKKSTAKKSTTKRTAAKKSTAKKATTNTDVTFTDDIPKVTREFGGNRRSKYDELLDTLVERYEDDKKATARMVFETVGQSTSRYQSIKGAIEKREDAHLFEVAQRTEGEDRVVYTKYDAELPEPEDEDTEEDDATEDDDEFIEDEDDVDF